MEAAKRARAEAEARAEEARGWDADGAGLDRAGRRLLQESRSRAAELQLHITEAEALHKEVKLLQAESGQLRRDLEVKCEMEVQYAQRGALQARRLGEEKARAASLEASLARVLQDFQRERDVQQAAHAAERSAAQADIVALRRLAKARGRALHKVRSLAQDLLHGRSELEVFLVTSLRMVRAEMGRCRQPLALTNGEEAGQDTLLGEELLTGTQIDIKDLTWEDREKVLRTMFAKLNDRRRKEKKQAELPPPSFDSEDDEVDNAAPLQGVANHAGPASLV
ncbi:probable basal body-orientation factor 1 [Coccomyxa sp. Obi]|nr:probable basal body-orientation factor 1 [Coccomyxa sp. Obi]